MSVKMFLMWNSKLLIDGGGDANVATSLLEASNVVVLRVFHTQSVCLFLLKMAHKAFICNLFCYFSLSGIICYTL